RMGWCRCYVFFFSSRRRHTRFSRDWSSDVCSSDLFQVSFFEGRTSRRGLPSAIPHSSAVKIKTTIKEFQASFFEGRTSRRGLPSAIPHSSAVKIKTTIKEFQASFFEGRTSRRGLPSAIPHSSAVKIKTTIKEFQASLILLSSFLFIRDLEGIRTPNPQSR